MPSRDFSSEDLVSSWMMSLHSSTHSSQMNTLGPAMSLRTSCWFLPQNEQKCVFFESPPATLLILALRQSRAPAPSKFLYSTSPVFYGCSPPSARDPRHSFRP